MNRTKLNAIRDAVVALSLPKREIQPNVGWFLPRVVRVSQYDNGLTLAWCEYSTDRGWLMASRENETKYETVYAVVNKDGTVTRSSIEEYERIAPESLATRRWVFNPWDARFPA